MVNALGGNATPMPYGEVYSAIQTGVIDGAENNYPSYDTAKHAEVAKFYSLDEHLMVPEVLVMSKSSWDKLTPEDQAIVKQAAKDSVAKQRELWDAREDLDGQGRCRRLDHHHDPDKKPFIDAMGPVYDKYVTDPKLQGPGCPHPGNRVMPARPGRTAPAGLSEARRRPGGMTRATRTD